MAEELGIWIPDDRRTPACDSHGNLGWLQR